MPVNVDGPYELRFFYSTQPLGQPLMQHVHTFDVLLNGPMTPPIDFEFVEAESRTGIITSLADFVDAYVLVLKELFNASSTIIRAELWGDEEEDGDKIFLGVYPIGVVGLVAGSASVAQQLTITFRSTNGGIMRMQLMETAYGGTAVDDYPFQDSDIQAYAAFVSGVASPITARDNGFPFSPLRASFGENERLWRKRFRNN